MEQRPSWKAYSHSADQEIPFLFMELAASYGVYKSLLQASLQPDDSGHNEGISEGLMAHWQAVPRKRWLLVLGMIYKQFHSYVVSSKNCYVVFLHDICIYPLFHAFPFSIIPNSVMQQVEWLHHWWKSCVLILGKSTCDCSWILMSSNILPSSANLSCGKRKITWC